MPKLKNQKRAYIFAFAAIACWSTIGSAFKITLRYTDPVTLLLISSFFACLVLFAILWLQSKIPLLGNISLKALGVSSVLGLLNPFLYYLVLLHAYDLLPAQEAGTLNYIWPLILVLLSIPILKQQIGLRSIAAILISFSGIVLISVHGDGTGFGFNSVPGVSLALGSAFLWALFWIFNLKDKRDEVVKLFLNFSFGFVYILLVVLISGRFRCPSRQAAAGSLYIGLFEMGITFVLWLYALRYSETTAKVSNLIYLSPFVSLIIIHFVVGEKILFTTVSGLFLIVAGIILQSFTPMKKGKAQERPGNFS